VKETEYGTVLEPNDEIVLIGNILSAIRRHRKSGVLDLIFLTKAPQHCAVQIIEGLYSQTHLVTVFADTQYALGENPSAPLEIKVDQKTLTTENISVAINEFLLEHFPEATSYKINFYETLQDYKSKA